MIFIHSSPRTSSTWFWSRFRQLPEVLAYFEIFAVPLLHMTLEDLIRRGPANLPLRHEATEPYYLEYLPLLAPKGGLSGVPSEAFAGFFPSGGKLREEEAAYIALLVDHARLIGRMPVLSAINSLARLGAIRSRFGGIHVLLYRNLVHQWASYLSFADTRPVFVNTIGQLFKAKGGPLFLQEVSRAFPLEGTRSDHPNWFCSFLLAHAFFYSESAPNSDLLVDSTRLGMDLDYRKETEQSICRLTGLRVDLSTARASCQAFVPVVEPTDILRRRVMPFVDLLPGSHSGRLFAENEIEKAFESLDRIRAGNVARGPESGARLENEAQELTWLIT